MVGPITIIEKFSTKVDFFIPNAYAPVFAGPRIELDGNKTILLNAEFIPSIKMFGISSEEAFGGLTVIS